MLAYAIDLNVNPHDPMLSCFDGRLKGVDILAKCCKFRFIHSCLDNIKPPQQSTLGRRYTNVLCLLGRATMMSS